MKNQKKYISKITSLCFVLPAVLVVVLLLLYPVCTSIFYSFTSKNLIKPSYKFVGLANYAKVLSDPEFLSAFLTSI